jgi:serine/threonine protein kinase
VLACPTCHSEYDPVVARYCSHCGSEVKHGTEEGADAWIDKVIDGRYRVQARVGTGGMGAVYRVEHVRMGKVAAMKVLHRELAKEDQIIKRFRREVEVVSRLNHPNIVQTFDFGSWEGLLYLIMEYVKGEDLGAMVKREGPLPLSRAIPLGMQICSALDEAHHAGVMHRDLKPENIVCVRRREEEHAKVLDFGLAKLRERPELGEITGAGNLIGTPYYMSPEQVRSENVDHRTDIYSLGGTLYRVLTGEFPFDGNSPMGIMSKHLTDDLVPPSERAPDRHIPPEIDRIILRAMARNRDHRYSSAGEMRHDLEAFIGGLTSGERHGRPFESQSDSLGGGDSADNLEREDFDAFERKERLRRRVASFVVAPVMVVGLVLAGWAVVRFLRPRPSTFEKEPNDTAAMATLLPRDRPVSGKVGAPRSDGEPDFDYYRIPAGSGPRAVTAKITGVPEIDLVLELFDATGKLVAKADHTRQGEGESLGPVAIGNGEAFVRARPVWTAGTDPSPGSDTPYELTVDWGRPRADWELEPNDTPALATKITKEMAVSGYLAAPDDQDWFEVKVPPGMRVDGRVDGIDGIDLVVLVGEERKRIDTAGAGEHEPFTAVPGKDGTVLVGITEQPVKQTGKKPPPPADRDEPYTLKLKFRPEESGGR